MSSSSSSNSNDGEPTGDESLPPDFVTPESDLSNPDRRIWIVTTAGLPWHTGTAINPMLRALQLVKGRPKGYVTLVIPWLADKDLQAKLYGSDKVFDARDEQEAWIRSYCAEIGPQEEIDNLRIMFYDSAYNSVLASLFPKEDICNLIPFDEADVAILEEPEHLNWVRVPPKVDKSWDDKTKKVAEIGWLAKFKHVVGILHTNYSAYMKQYSYGVSIITASALSALSSIVVKAYCHRLIRLSDALPVLDETKEITCNVHGVRAAFLEPSLDPKANDSKDDFEPAEIYFIGKIAWAKGFDNLLKVEAHYRKATGEYFPIDIYGSGNNEVAIKRGFFGREGITTKRSSDDLKRWQGDPPKDERAAEVFERQGSLREGLESSQSQYPREDASDRPEGNPSNGDGETSNNPDDSSALAIIENLTSQSVSTGTATTTAVKKMVKDLFKLGYHVAFCNNPTTETDDDDNHNNDREDEDNEKPTEIGKESKLSKLKKVSSFNFDPPQSLFELRRIPIPARFLGVKDHALLRDIPGHKIFLNMSTTEVLCTTTAEAVAMGKFVILPEHPSNTFFIQFPNCLSYSSEAECVEKLQWARQNQPQPLSKEHAHILSWEGATERLYKAAAMTQEEARERKESGTEKSARNIANYHIESNKKGSLIQRMVLGFK